MTRDEEHLRILSIFHYVVAGIVALFSLFPVIHRGVRTDVIVLVRDSVKELFR